MRKKAGSVFSSTVLLSSLFLGKRQFERFPSGSVRREYWGGRLVAASGTLVPVRRLAASEARLRSYKPEERNRSRAVTHPPPDAYAVSAASHGRARRDPLPGRSRETSTRPGRAALLGAAASAPFV